MSVRQGREGMMTPNMAKLKARRATGEDVFTYHPREESARLAMGWFSSHQSHHTESQPRRGLLW